MSATAEAPIEPGLPVEIGRIDKELGKLWEDSRRHQDEGLTD